MATRYLNYFVHLTDPDQVRTLQEAYPTGRYLAPTVAAATYAAPIQEESAAFSAPCTRSSWFTSTANYPRDQGMFKRKKGGFFGAIAGIFGVKDTYWWLGWFVFAVGAPAADPTTGVVNAVGVAPMARRAWICGFAMTPSGAASPQSLYGEGPDNNGAASMISRAASRLAGGFGMAMRGAIGQATISRNKFGAAASHNTWERMYVIRRADGAGGFWCALNSGSSGAFLQSIGADVVFWNGSTAGPTMIGSFSGALAVINTVYRLDILYRFATATIDGSIELFVNGVSKGSFTVTTGGAGIGSNTNHDNTQLRHLIAGTPSVDLELDFSDWMGADWPANPWDNATNYIVGDYVMNYTPGTAGRKTTDITFYKALAINGPASTIVTPGTNAAVWGLVTAPIDWSNGSHMQLVRPNGFSASHANWTGIYQQAMQGFPTAPTAKMNPLTSTTSGANGQVTTDAVTQLKNFPESKGVAAFVVAAHWLRAGAASGSLGYKIGGAGAVTSAITQQTGLSWQGFMYRPLGVTDPIDISPLELIFIKAANGNTDQLAAIGCVAELIGRFGPEDMPPGNSDLEVPSSTQRGPVHNAPYPVSHWVRAKQAPPATINIIASTYVGNGTAVELTFRFPPCYIYIRPTSVAVPGVRWFSSMIAATPGVDETPKPINVIKVEVDPTFAGATVEDDQEVRYRVRIAGSDSNVNQNAVTYQYVAFCDPGQRFMSNGAAAHHTSSVLNKTNSLENSAFTPDAIVIQNSRTEGATVAAGYYKGPGHGANDATHIASGSGNVVTAASFNGAGQFISKSGIHQSNMVMQWMALRGNDLSGDANVQQVFRCFSYIGDGIGSRSISISGAPGLRPLFAMIVPHSTAGALYRDPSHTSTNCMREGGANVTDGITAGGVDSLNVGASANANGTVYDVWVMLGSATAGNNGWSVGGDFMPVDFVDAPGDYITPPDQEDQGIDPDTGEPIETPPAPSSDPDIDNITDVGEADVDFGGLTGGQVCEVYTRGVANRALRYLGITKRITDLVNNTTIEAVLSRDAITEDVNQVLRDFDWPFATRYAELVLVGGTDTDPVNVDWQYSYRSPAAMMKARRIGSQEDLRRGWDPTPIKFRLTTDTTGGLIYCDAPASADVPLVLEYTVRLACPVFFGDALFREAVAWKHAASLAQPLCKDSKKQELCLEMYRATLSNARVPAAQEEQKPVDGDASWITDRN